MKSTIASTMLKMSFLFFATSLTALSASAQNKVQKAPPFKSTRTTVHRAEQKETTWIPGAIIDQIHFVRYNRNGSKIAENSLKPDGSADKKIIYVYDANGNVQEEIMASIKVGGVSNVYQYHYDEQGRIDGKKKLDAQRIATSVDTIIRNDAGLIIERIRNGIIRHQQGKLTRYRETVTINYNNEGQVTGVVEKSTLDRNGTPVNRELLKKDTVPLKHASEGAFNRYEAPKSKRVDTDYDMYGNWIKRIEYSGANPEYIVMRAIEYAGPEDTDWKKMLLKGKVKTVNQTSYVALPNGPDIINHGQKKGNFFICKFDKNGRKVMVSHFSDTGVPKGSTEYVYDANGNIEKEIDKSVAGKIESTAQLTYDDEGELRSKAFLDANGEMSRKTIYRYDGEGNCIAELCFNKDGSKYSDIRNKYDPYGNLIIREIPITPAETKGEEYLPITRIWNSRGRVVEEKIGTPGNERHYTYQYSTRGEVISGTESINNQPPVKFVYKFYYDKYGNWKKRIKFLEEKPVVYEERVYTYYE